MKGQSASSGHVSGCMMTACYATKTLPGWGGEADGWGGSCRESLFWWVRWRRGGVLVPDPCLSGAAMFTVRKEAVNCVCSHLSKTEQLLARPPPSLPTPTCLHTLRERPMCCTFWEDGKSKAKAGSVSWTDSIQSASVHLWESEEGPERRASPCKGPEVIDRAFYLRYRVSPWCKVPVALFQRVTAFLTRS